MLILVTYDVATSSIGGSKRLRQVAKVCERYGIRVQNSVFECVVDATQKKQFEQALLKVINKKEDSIRIYQLGKNYKSKITQYGAKETRFVEDPLIF